MWIFNEQQNRIYKLQFTTYSFNVNLIMPRLAVKTWYDWWKKINK